MTALLRRLHPRSQRASPFRRFLCPRPLASRGVPGGSMCFRTRPSRPIPRLALSFPMVLTARPPLLTTRAACRIESRRAIALLRWAMPSTAPPSSRSRRGACPVLRASLRLAALSGYPPTNAAALNEPVLAGLPVARSPRFFRGRIAAPKRRSSCAWTRLSWKARSICSAPVPTIHRRSL